MAIEAALKAVGAAFRPWGAQLAPSFVSASGLPDLIDAAGEDLDCDLIIGAASVAGHGARKAHLTRLGLLRSGDVLRCSDVASLLASATDSARAADGLSVALATLVARRPAGGDARARFDAVKADASRLQDDARIGPAKDFAKFDRKFVGA
jgi:hypothetical protein